ncbi:acyl-CoA dehydrogenase [Desulfonema ishimotonii]|uniref:Acyl-CoA dehydrogenase n=1 Tax=Desulfonema ishimotonii TaxID=45657 RepID=A0A401G042_9BACT|nr:acyl-CoA dehydrogenase [Desulfonema ishimotonii]GBC62556.1 acyl-CoA dehydrogenase [Desulfonema ishimotonii]
MAQTVADRRDVDFVLHEQLAVENLSKHELFADFSKKTVDLVISEARNLAIKEMMPVLKAGDEEGCTFESGKVSVPESFHRVYELFKEGEWIAMCDDPQWGGQGMPSTVSLAAKNFFHGANFPFMLAILLGHGAGKLVEKFGTDKQKELFLKKMYTGEWGGTMLLTEPEAGSDVGALTTTAVKNDDGTYSITGNKIFISSGEQDLTKNIIHPVLARIEGAPAGTAGISLFLVPKIWVNDDGSFGEPNDIACTGIEEKMGIHGSPTCSMTLGSKGQCRGTLLGEANKGMRAMFVMMNEARLDVGMQALGCASASYLNALNYARERVQGRHLRAGGKDAPGVPIIQHPDVRRMLLGMKTCTEGCRSLLFYIGLCEDMIHISNDADEKARYQGLIDVLIPIAKGYVTDRAFEVCSQGVQIYGGYGYTKEYPQEQYLRDCKITHIYEGTNSIQAMDLLGRKLGLNKGRAFGDLMAEIRKTTETAKGIPALAELAGETEAAVAKLEETARHIGLMAASDRMMTAFAHAYALMEVTGDAVMAWMLLWRASIAAQKLEKGAKKKDTPFYEGQMAGARFFIRTVLPVSLGKMDVISGGDSIAADISDDAFGGK